MIRTHPRHLTSLVEAYRLHPMLRGASENQLRLLAYLSMAEVDATVTFDNFLKNFHVLQEVRKINLTFSIHRDLIATEPEAFTPMEDL